MASRTEFNTGSKICRPEVKLVDRKWLTRRSKSGMWIIWSSFGSHKWRWGKWFYFIWSCSKFLKNLSNKNEKNISNFQNFKNFQNFQKFFYLRENWIFSQKRDHGSVFLIKMKNHNGHGSMVQIYHTRNGTRASRTTGKLLPESGKLKIRPDLGFSRFELIRAFRTVRASPEKIFNRWKWGLCWNVPRLGR